MLCQNNWFDFASTDKTNPCLFRWYRVLYYDILLFMPLSSSHKAIEWFLRLAWRSKNWDHVSSYLCTYKLKFLVSDMSLIPQWPYHSRGQYFYSSKYRDSITTISNKRSIQKSWNILPTTLWTAAEHKKGNEEIHVPWNCRDALNHQVIFISHACKLIIVILKMWFQLLEAGPMF